MVSRRDALMALAEHIRPELSDEIARLYATEAVLELAQETNAELARRNHRLTVAAGDLRQRLVRAEARLEQLDVDAISTARRVAFLSGTSFLRITSLGRGRFRTEHVPIEKVMVRGD